MSELIKIGNYILTRPLCGQGSGYSKWGFAYMEDDPDKTEYFIKEFISPVYPDSSSEISSDLRKSIIRGCEKFSAKKSKLYSAINSASNGNIIGVNDFFRFKTRYYIITDKIDISPYDFKAIAKIPLDKKLLLLRVLLYSVKCIHDSGVIHADLKPGNIIIKRTENDFFTAKLIDFDSSFFENEPPDNKDDIQGDPVYLSPETFLCIAGEEASLTTRLDIFSLGIIFHEILCGERPAFDDCYDYIYESVLDGVPPEICPDIPPSIGVMIRLMLSADPMNRPRADEISQALSAASEFCNTSQKKNNYFSKPKSL